MTKTTIADQELVVASAIRISHEAWEMMSDSVYVRMNKGLPVERLPHISLEAAEVRAARAKTLLAQIATIDEALLPKDLVLTLRVIHFRASRWAKEADWYWLVCDPLGVGFYGLFCPTSYNGGFLFSAVHQALAAFEFKEPGDLDRYLALVADYARLIGQMQARSEGQAERGIYMPQPQVEQASKLIELFAQGAPVQLSVAESRLRNLDTTAFLVELQRRIDTQVLPAFPRFADMFDDAYLAQAPETVGLGQYPGGAELYAELAKLHVTLDFTPAQLHQAGLDRMRQIKQDMQVLRDELQFTGDEQAFDDFLNTDAQFRADSVEGVEAVFKNHIDRIKPLMDSYFALQPKAPYGVSRLDASLESSMTFGFYRAPTPAKPRGEFNYNAANLTRQSLVNVGALTYHELVPGHHFHLATQMENETLHPFRQASFINAYNEGWAEYAATLAGEMGMYVNPYDRYGRLIMDAFLTSRLVVDTGMNVLGWSLQQAQEYMRANTFMSETEICSETIRYSCDIPGQPLAYKMGDTFMLELREKMRAARGESFDIKEFHSAILAPGALPLQDLAWHIEHVIQQAVGEG